MMKVHDNNIVHMRGDTDTLTLNVTGATVSTAVLSVKKDYGDTDYAFQITTVGNVFTFTHDMTNKLAAGNYVYDVQATLSDGTVQTVVNARYTLLPDVTRE